MTQESAHREEGKVGSAKRSANRSPRSHLGEVTQMMWWCRLCNFVLKGDLPVSFFLEEAAPVGSGVQGAMYLWLGERALGKVSDEMGPYPWCCPDLRSVSSTHARSWEKQSKQNPSRALIFPALISSFVEGRR